MVAVISLRAEFINVLHIIKLIWGLTPLIIIYLKHVSYFLKKM